MAIKLTRRTTWVELAGMIRGTLGLGERFGDKLISALLATCLFWFLGGAFFSLGFVAPAGSKHIVFMVTFLMWGPCTLAIIAGFHNIFTAKD